MSTLSDTSPWDRFPAPPCARTLGWRLIAQEPARGFIRIGFQARPVFLNPAGYVQGGFLAAMLDDAMGPAVLAHTHGQMFTSTISMTITYLAPVRAGAVIVEANVVQLGRTIATIEASLLNADGDEAARAISSARLVPVGKLPVA